MGNIVTFIMTFKRQKTVFSRVLCAVAHNSYLDYFNGVVFRDECLS